MKTKESISLKSTFSCANSLDLDFSKGNQSYCKGVTYLGKDSNPFYCLYDVNPEWFFDPDVVIHPNCKVVAKAVLTQFDIKKIVFPKGLETIEEGAFEGCNYLKRIIIKEGTKYIGDYAFRFCTRVTRVELPSSIKELGKGSFDCLFELKTLIYHGSLKQWKRIKKDGWINDDADFDVICNDGKEHISFVKRYSFSNDKDKLINKQLVKDQIDEVLNADRDNRVNTVKSLLPSFKELLEKRLSSKKANDVINGLVRLFISSRGRCTKAQYDMYLDVFDIDEKELSFRKFYNLMTLESNKKLEALAFDYITIRLPLFRRLYAVIIGVAMLGTNKLTKKNYKLIDELIGPIKEN